MKITYESVTGTIEIEVSEHWGKVIAELDYQEDRVNRRETRRHEHLDLSMDESPWLKSNEKDPEEALMSAENIRKVCRALMQLTDKQREAFLAIHFYGYGVREYAKKISVDKSIVSRRLHMAEKKIKKFL